MPKPILMYLSYGTGPHVDEVIFSALSAVHRRRPVDPFEIVILTDSAEPFTGLPVTIELIRPEQMTDWGGPKNFGHRRKILAFAEVMKKYAAPVILADGDTYFRQSPSVAFNRIGPGRSIMHVREGELGYLAAHGHHRDVLSNLSFTLTDGEKVELKKETPVCNAGVLGMDLADLKLIDKVVELTDAIHDADPSWLSEQVSFSYMLANHTKLSTCRDVIFHFHEKVMRKPFREQIRGWLTETASLPPEQRAAALYKHRPRPPFSKTIKALFKRPFKKLGFFRHDLQTSV